MASNHPIHHDPDRQRFHDGDASLAYRLPSDGVIEFYSVQVPPERRGGGLAGHLTRAAFAHARAQGLKVRPTCPYVSGAFLKRNAEYEADLET